MGEWLNLGGHVVFCQGETSSPLTRPCTYCSLPNDAEHFVAGSVVRIPRMPDILLPVSSLTFNQSSKSGRDYPDGFQSERVRCQADVSTRAAASVEACHP